MQLLHVMFQVMLILIAIMLSLMKSKYCMLVHQLPIHLAAPALKTKRISSMVVLVALPEWEVTLVSLVVCQLLVALVELANMEGLVE
ncbi:hypothetical protein NC653_009526 [Populus alba x Populus x berolinensis]|uniref:Uncharacterized protein n=1 Tax=Populus alba x Populus x berolinensis TaxID=444605 RepID=A0AAD6R9E9_9ROSI|nr:hypothetical protein NC653_009526 [Populus alba x Populus x berolinensis]